MRTVKLLFFLVVVALLVNPFPSTAQKEAYWPTAGWRASTPEEQGMSSAELAEFFKTLSQPYFNMDSLIVIRHGYIVAEAHSAPSQAEGLHQLYSVSKSVISSLIGIAIDQGYIKSVNEKLLSFFPEYTPANMDERKAAITVKDLLTMGSGFKCDAYGADPTTDAVDKMLASKNTSQMCLDLPMAYKPGEKQQYCQCNAYLLGSILARKTGMDGLAFAKKNLFTPLGITEARWLTTKEGIVEGYSGLHLKPSDMAKFGYLFLNKGQWDGKQIVSAQYVADSISNQLATPWPDTAYGYLWWIHQSPNAANAIGLSGQYILLFPSKDMLMVLTGGFNWTLQPSVLSSAFVYSGSKLTTASGPRPANPEGMRQLKAVIDTIASPAPQPVKSLPVTTKAVSDQPFAMLSPLEFVEFAHGPDVPKTQVKAVSFKFGSADQAVLTLIPVQGQPKDVVIGLDGLYRTSDFWGGKVAARGEWLTDNDFRVYLKYIGDIFLYRLDVTFMPGAMTVVSSESASGMTASHVGMVVQPE